MSTILTHNKFFRTTEYKPPHVEMLRPWPSGFAVLQLSSPDSYHVVFAEVRPEEEGSEQLNIKTITQ